MSSENKVQREIWLGLGWVCTLFRLNTGKAWISGSGPAKRLNDGTVIVPSGRPIALGFSKPNGDPLNGAGDLNGWTEIVVTPEMVGCKVAVFTSVETKRTKGGRTSDDQINYRDQIIKAGGIAVIANSLEVALNYIKSWLPPKA